LSDEDLSIQAIINQPSSSSSSAALGNQQADRQRQVQKEVFYSTASELLIQARKQICEYSATNTHNRILRTKAVRESEERQAEEDNNALSLYAYSKDLQLNSSQVGDERPLTSIRYSSNGAYLATGSLSCVVKVWDVKSLNCELIGRGHEERITSVSWNPNMSSGAFFASSSADKTCKLWSLSSKDAMTDEPSSIDNTSKAILTFNGHSGVVSSCEFHPMGSYIGTSSHDYTWRLWDVETGSELLLQDGHTKDCSVVTFQQDGSLAMSGDIAGLVLVWDIRSGQCIQVFQGHIKKIVNAHWNANGFQLATCSVDNQVRIWDMRKRKCSYILPAHSNAITDARFSSSGELLATSSFDGSIKIFGTRDYRLLDTMTGHLGKIMSCDYCPDEKHIASAGYDRTFKLWAHKDEF
jgi:U4/U6 small nuclear ribonucleoprotein PRP4